MCRRVECARCKKPTYAGCGMHIEQVLGDVAAADRCHCREERRDSKAAAAAAAAAKRESGDAAPSFFKRLFGG